MPRIEFTSNLKTHVQCQPTDVSGLSVREVLNEVFERNGQLRHYVLDDQGKPRTHIAIFINGELIKDRDDLSDPVGDNDDVYVMQALSGG